MIRPSMFPDIATNKITVFPRYTDSITGNQINETCILDGCIWNENSVAIANRTGTITGFKVTVRIPYLSMYTGRKYVSQTLWAKLPYEELKNYWTINPKQLPLICNGVLNHQFTWAPQTGANTIAVQENALLNSNPNVRRVTDVNEILLSIQPDMTEDDVKLKLPDSYEELHDYWTIVIRA